MGKTIESVKDKNEDDLLNLPNVCGVGIGEKGGKKVIKVFLEKKVDKSKLKPDQIIPKKIEGFEIDIEIIGSITINN